MKCTPPLTCLLLITLASAFNQAEASITQIQTTYDANGRITSEIRSGLGQEVYAYDGAGNLRRRERWFGTGPLRADWVGIEVNFPLLGTLLPRAVPPRTVVKVASGTELIAWLSSPTMDVDLDDTSVTFRNFGDYPGYPGESGFTGAAFNGPVVRLPVNGRWTFASAQWSSATTLGGQLLAPTVEPFRLSINWASNTYSAATLAQVQYALSPATPRDEFNVPAVPESGVLFLATGSQCSFSSSGLWHWDAVSAAVGPEGSGSSSDSRFPMPSAPAFSLVTRNELTGEMLYVGVNAELQTQAGAPISFLMNDAAGSYGDNRGEISVKWKCD